MRLKYLAKLLLLAFMLVAGNSAASFVLKSPFVASAQAAVVNSIDVRGNQRIDDITVASYLTIEPGQRFGNADIDDSIKALFGTGLFSDVAIFQQGSVLVVDVDENATINKVFFEGNKRLKDDALKSIVTLRDQGIYSDEQAGVDVERISEAYGRVGRRDATVSFEVLPLENNRVNVIYRVNEGGNLGFATLV
ncbi:MAG: POTRA domain-containing protein, partial [Pseudomonadota bacterium]